MRLQVDARLLRGGGIGRYLRELSRRWLTDPLVDRVRFLGRPPELEPWLAEVDARGIAEVTSWSDGPYSPVSQLRWPWLARGLAWRADATFFPHFDVPLVAHPHPSVVAVHDLIHFQVPEGFPRWKRVAGAVLLRGAVDRARAVVTVSEASRAALEAFHPRIGPRVHTIPNGVAEVFRPVSDEERAAASRSRTVPQRFLLTVGRPKRHKNLDFAVRVLARVPTEMDLHLLMVGTEGEAETEALARLARSLGVERSVRLMGSVSDAHLRELYALATALLLPSSLEGFGLPVVECLACGGRALVPELPWARGLMRVGARGLPPDDPAAWAGAVLECLEEPTSSPQGFPITSWAESARRTLEVIAECARG
jgi:alpha-1,3-rhamnosyl/mannosyltransferase